MSDEETKVRTPESPRGFWERLAQIGLPRLAVGVVLLAAIVDLSINYFTDVTRNVKPSVVAVVSFDGSGKRLAEGSGFFVDPRRVITSRHLMLGASKAEISIGRSRWQVEGVAAEDEMADLVSLTVPHAGRPLDVPRCRLLRNEPAIVIGRSHARGIRVARGRISHARAVQGLGTVALTSASVRIDCTGSPVVNEKGGLIGVAVSRLVDGRKLSYVLSAELVRKMKPGRVTALEVYGARNAMEWPDTAAGLRSKGLLFVIVRDYKRALPYFEKALGRNPNDHRAIRLAGNCYLEMREYGKAFASAQRAIKVEPDNAVGYYLLGSIYGDQKRWREAAVAFTQAAQLDPKDGYYLVCLGYAYDKLGRNREAIDAYERGVRIDPHNAVALYDLGWAYMDAGRYDAAISAFERAARANPYIADPYFGLGYVYVKLDDSPASLNAYRQAKQA